MLKDYKDIKYQDWPVSGAKAAVLMIHGMGAHTRRFAYFAERLNAQQISGYAVELEGFGERCGDIPGHVDSIKKYHSDIKSLKEIIERENSGKPVFIMGESMGGLLVTTHVLSHDSAYAGLVAVVPAYKDVFKFNIVDRINIFLLSVFNRKKQVVMPFSSEQLTRDPEILEKLKADPKEHRFASASLLRELLFEQLNVMSNIAGIKTPVLILSAGKDLLVDTGFTVKMFNKIKGDKKQIIYQDSLHALTIEKNREEVFKDIIEWIKAKSV